MNFLKYLVLIIRGRWRLSFGFCPKCNSDAPELYTCDICNYDTSWLKSIGTKRKWRKKFEDQLGGGSK